MLHERVRHEEEEERTLYGAVVLSVDAVAEPSVPFADERRRGIGEREHGNRDSVEGEAVVERREKVADVERDRMQHAPVGAPLHVVDGMELSAAAEPEDEQEESAADHKDRPVRMEQHGEKQRRDASADMQQLARLLRREDARAWLSAKSLSARAESRVKRSGRTSVSMRGSIML